MKTRPRRSSATKSPRLRKSARYAKSSRTLSTPGVHNRRDKRYPMFKQRVIASDLDDEPSNGEMAFSVDETAQWREAVMLWLSWNRTDERLNAKLCRAECSVEKLAALRDEMEDLRQRAIELSEHLMEEL